MHRTWFDSCAVHSGAAVWPLGLVGGAVCLASIAADGNRRLRPSGCDRNLADDCGVGVLFDCAAASGALGGIAWAGNSGEARGRNGWIVHRRQIALDMA